MREIEVNRGDVERLPYLRAVPSGGRIAPLLTYYDHEQSDWHLHLPVEPGRLGRIAGGETISGSYIAKTKPEREDDLEWSLGTLVAGQLSFADVLDAESRLESDVHRMSAILEKYHLMWSTSRTGSRSAALLVQSELEYLLFLLRSFYDLMQALLRRLVRRFVLLDGSNTRAVKDLPGSFRAVVLEEKAVRTSESLIQRWGMPAALADWYATEGPSFVLMRELRDGIAHRGQSPPTVFETEWGFAFDPDAPPWDELDGWPTAHRWEGRLGSLHRLFGGFIAHSLGAAARLALALRRSVQLPEPILEDGVRMYVRGPFVSRLVALDSLVDQPWEGLTDAISTDTRDQSSSA
jgi:hypothetical protein